MQRATSRFDWILICATFGAAALYALQGALRHHLFIPVRYTPGHDAVLSGIAAWAVFSGVIAIWLGLALRLGFMALPTRRRLFWEFLLLILGILLASAGIGGYLPSLRDA
jgi:hypothetical protein